MKIGLAILLAYVIVAPVQGLAEMGFALRSLPLFPSDMSTLTTLTREEGSRFENGTPKVNKEGPQVDDVTLAKYIKGRLLENPETYWFAKSLDVDVNGGKVTIEGIVAGEEMRDAVSHVILKIVKPDMFRNRIEIFSLAE